MLLVELSLVGVSIGGDCEVCVVDVWGADGDFAALSRRIKSAKLSADDVLNAFEGFGDSLIRFYQPA